MIALPPDHPDYELIMQVMAELDQASDAAAAEDILGRLIHRDSVIHAGSVRADEMVNEPPQLPFVAELAGAWIEGFIAGMIVQHRKTEGAQA